MAADNTAAPERRSTASTARIQLSVAAGASQWATAARCTARMRRRAAAGQKAVQRRCRDGARSDVPRFLHLTNGRLYYVASSGGEDCVIRMNADGTSREVLDRAGVILRFALHDGVMYLLDANGSLKERTLSGEESDLMEGVADFCLDVQGNALLCVTQEGVVSFGIDTGRQTTLYAGAADQAAMCGRALLVRVGGAVVRVADGQNATIRRDGATFLGAYGQRVIQLTGQGVMTCDVNGENATTILYGEYETMSAETACSTSAAAGRDAAGDVISVNASSSALSSRRSFVSSSSRMPAARPAKLRLERLQAVVSAGRRRGRGVHAQHGRLLLPEPQKQRKQAQQAACFFCRRILRRPAAARARRRARSPFPTLAKVQSLSRFLTGEQEHTGVSSPRSIALAQAPQSSPAA